MQADAVRIETAQLDFILGLRTVVNRPVSNITSESDVRHRRGISDAIDSAPKNWGSVIGPRVWRGGEESQPKPRLERSNQEKKRAVPADDLSR